MMKMNRRLAAGGLALLMTGMLCLTGCGKLSASEPVNMVSFTDSAGRTVEIPEKIDEIAPSGSYAQIFLITLCPDRLMGLSTALTRTQKQFLPDYLQDLSVFGQFYGGSGTVNYEAIMEAAPDVIIDIGERKPTIAEDMDEIQSRTHIPTIFIETSLAQTPETFTLLGQITGCGERAEKLASYCRGVLDLAEQNTASLTEEERMTVYIGDGEYGNTAVPAGSVHSEAADLAGADNVAVLSEYASSGMQEVSMEQILMWNPEAVFLTPDANYEEIYDDAAWSNVQAVRDHRVYEIPSSPYNWLDRPPSVQRILGILWMGNLLYSDRFDYDMKEKTKEFYGLFYQYELSDEEAEELLSHSTLAGAS